MNNFLKNLSKRVLCTNSLLQSLHLQNEKLIKKELESIKLLTAKNILEMRLDQKSFRSVKDSEFKVFSQFGEDGIIQYLIRECDITPEEEIFVEFGVEDYTESNTRFLLLNNNWKGVIIDQSAENIKSIRNSEISWKYDLKAVSSFVTRDNINDIISGAELNGKIGLLSIDIDGNDYWVWERIKCIDPVIVVIEYNSLFGFDKNIVVPYEENFGRSKAHYSCLYWGASIMALTRLAAQKEYSLVSSNSAGNNLFFVKNSRLGTIKALSVNEGYVRSKYRDSRNSQGYLSFLDLKQQREAIESCLVLDLDKNELIPLSEVFKLYAV